MSPHFKLSEFQCKDGTPLIILDSELVESLELLRQHIKKPIIINSAYRTIEYNKLIGGEDGSYHTKGQAVDVVVDGYTPSEIAKIAERFGFDGIGVYADFTHIDVRGYKARWNKK